MLFESAVLEREDAAEERIPTLTDTNAWQVTRKTYVNHVNIADAGGKPYRIPPITWKSSDSPGLVEGVIVKGDTLCVILLDPEAIEAKIDLDDSAQVRSIDLECPDLGLLMQTVFETVAAELV